MDWQEIIIIALAIIVINIGLSYIRKRTIESAPEQTDEGEVYQYPIIYKVMFGGFLVIFLLGAVFSFTSGILGTGLLFLVLATINAIFLRLSLKKLIQHDDGFIEFRDGLGKSVNFTFKDIQDLKYIRWQASIQFQLGHSEPVSIPIFVRGFLDLLVKLKSHVGQHSEIEKLEKILPIQKK